uniref:Uncharacterized protein n=1 Tax=Rhizophora mucronata TaxID=61149 RepID=A0A2P2KCE4_RHIMU
MTAHIHSIAREANSCPYFLLNIPNRDLMAFTAFSLINDSSNLFKSSSNSSDVLKLARSGSVRILCYHYQQFQSACRVAVDSC